MNILFKGLFFCILLSILILSFFYFENKKDKDLDNIEKAIYGVAEQAYYEGQKDAIEGDIRIALDGDSVYVWIKSPWDDTDRKLNFNPKTDTIYLK